MPVQKRDTASFGHSAEHPMQVLRRKPNIVMIVLDDVGYAEWGCYGSDIETPALDSLAAD